MKAIDFVLHWADFLWQWFGVIIGVLFLIALAVAIIAFIVDYCLNKFNHMKLFLEFLEWKRNPEIIWQLKKDKAYYCNSLNEANEECRRLRVMATSYIDAYANMKQFAIDNGLNVTATNLPDPCEGCNSSPEDCKGLAGCKER